MKLPVLSGREVIKILESRGFEVVRQKGDHVRLKKIAFDETLNITIPLHREIKKGTLLRIIRDARLEKEDFVK